MDILTKICIVILVVLILVGCPVFISLATEPANWKDIAMKERERNAMYAKSVQYAMLGEQRAVADRAELKTRLDKEKDALTAQVGQLRADLDKSQGQFSSLQKDTQNTSSAVVALQQNLDQVIKDRRQLEGQFTDARQRISDLNKSYMDLEKDHRKLVIDYAGLQELLRRREEQAKQSSERIVELERQLREPPGAGPLAKPAETEVPIDAKIEAKVDEVKGDIVTINVGSAQGVKKGMKLFVHRGAQLVGRLRVDEVDPDKAGGVLMDKVLDPAKGDTVTSHLK